MHSGSDLTLRVSEAIVVIITCKRLLPVIAVLAGTWAGQTLLADIAAQSAQPYYCTCKGEKQRFLASTRHCEVALGLPKSRTCGKTQLRVIYGLACAKMSCKFAN